MSEQQPQAAPGGQMEIKIADNFAGGEYANNMQAAFNKEEFILTFFNIVASSGRVCGKIISSPGHVKRMAVVLSDMVKKYEEQFGAIAQAESPKEGIGFKV
jgi:hypothetical protein